MGATESDIQAAYFDWLKAQPAPVPHGGTLWDYAYAVPNGMVLAGNTEQRARAMAAAKRRGLKNGVSDICLALPVGRYPGAYIELKRDKRSPVSKDQTDWLDRMQRAGYYAGLAIGYDSLLEHTRNFLAG